jgi:hypothetical protein
MDFAKTKAEIYKDNKTCYQNFNGPYFFIILIQTNKNKYFLFTERCKKMGRKGKKVDLTKEKNSNIKITQKLFVKTFDRLRFLYNFNKKVLSFWVKNTLYEAIKKKGYKNVCKFLVERFIFF